MRISASLFGKRRSLDSQYTICRRDAATCQPHHAIANQNAQQTRSTHLISLFNRYSRSLLRDSKPAKGQQVGYLRVSSVDQNEVRQLEGLALVKTFTDKAAGMDARGGLERCVGLPGGWSVNRKLTVL
jgi:hypothetical protein